MSLKRLLGIISVVIIVVFGLMLTTSYAWYAFDNASTTFDVVTNNDDVIISYQTGEYISTNIAVPISSSQVSKYSEKNNFTIKVKDNKEDNEMAVTISLVDIAIDNYLRDSNFKVELYHQSSRVATVAGNGIGANGATTKTLGTVVLDNDVENNFELRVYILDNGADQSNLMNKSFQAKIKVNVVSRLKTSFQDYDNSDIRISSIMIDGVASDSLPTSGYHDMTASCTKGSNLTWDPISKTITYNSGSYVNDDCGLTFTTSTNPDYPLLSEMPVGSYVAYTGNNGCTGNSCKGYNANYVSDTDMGYCYNSSYKFYTNGWRIGYKENGSAYLISGGAPECMCTGLDGKFSDSSATGSGNYSSTGCKGYVSNNDLSKHYDNMDELSLKYCNEEYVSGGVCDNNTTWAMDATDFKKITGSDLNGNSCLGIVSSKVCGYSNDLIDNGSNYWFATAYELGDMTRTYYWMPSYRKIIAGDSSYDYSDSVRGVRPVIKLDTSIIVIGGIGTYDDPYIISDEAI